MPLIYGINPVLEALESKQSIDKIYLQQGKQGGVISTIRRQARQLGIPVVQADRTKLRRLTEDAKHQGIAALIAPIFYTGLSDLVEKIQKFGQTPNLVILDGIQDPHNFGAIIRSAEVLGVHGIIFNLRESVPITDVVIKSSAGAVFHIDICKVNNLASAVTYLKKCGILIYASSYRGKKTVWDMDFTSPQAVIIGSEGKGIRASLVKLSDETFRIPQTGKTGSLNASVAAGIILAEIRRQFSR